MVRLRIVYCMLCSYFWLGSEVVSTTSRQKCQMEWNRMQCNAMHWSGSALRNWSLRMIRMDNGAFALGQKRIVLLLAMHSMVRTNEHLIHTMTLY